jgi:cell division protein FtsB
MREISGERLGIALRTLAQDLVSERRRVTQLERENQELRRELEQLRHSVADRDVEAVLSD